MNWRHAMIDLPSVKVLRRISAFIHFLKCIILSKINLFVCPVSECPNVSEYYDEVFDRSCKRYSYTLRREICRWVGIKGECRVFQ